MNCLNEKYTVIIILGIFFFASQFEAHSSEIGVLLADSSGKIHYARNKDQKLIPASTLKVLTGLVALDILGSEYKFKTLFSFDRETGNLYVKGFGDPLFISEAAQIMCQQIIRDTGLSRIHHIILDTSFFHPDIRIPGTGNTLNPYDAVTGALCANFNTITFDRDPITRKYVSPEPQTPLIKAFLPLIQASGQDKGRIRLTKDKAKVYPGFLLKALFKQMDIEVTGEIMLGKYKTDGMVQGTFHSPFSLHQVVQKLLQYSNNFMANQVMLTLGGGLETPARVAAGTLVLKNYAEKKLGLATLSIVEGSGLSRLNRITPAQMLNILLAFMPNHTLMNNNENEFYKTGTLTGVRSRVGYLKGQDGQLYPFVIMVNKSDKGYADIQNRLKQKVDEISSTLN